MADDGAPGAVYDSKKETEAGPDFVNLWLDALARSEAEEKEWRQKAEETLEVYRGAKGSKGRSFNIFHSNIETLCPALYNSTPAADVRRRYADPDPVGKAVADLIERALEFSIDTYDFDAVIKTVIKDGEIVGRGVPRVRYETKPSDEPIMGPDGQPMMGEDGQPIFPVAYETVTCDYVPWRYFRRGPGRTWKDVPWIAFGDFLTKDEMRKLNPQIAETISYNYSADGSDKGKKAGAEEQSIFRRCLVWQIWDKDNRRVISIAPDYTDAPVATMDDPLELSGFFPVPRPYQPIMSPDSLTPVVPYEIYEDLVTELNEVTARISRLVRQCRPRGIYGGQEALDVATWANADDGELVPATNAAAFANGSMENLISWFPLDTTVRALAQLVQQRELVKQTIYEVTGIADILRGSTHASETATAQQIKAQWGSLRIQDRQGEVARVIRDLFRLKAEIVCSKFSWDTLSQMTGIVLPSAQEKAMAQQIAQQIATAQQSGQPVNIPPELMEQGKKILSQPSQEEAEKLLRSDVLRSYRVDVESDSTIRGDLSRNQQTMALFLQGTAQFAQAVGPIVQQFPAMAPVMMEIYSAFSRHFKLGKQAEDALDGLADTLKQASQNQPQHRPDPKVEAVKAKADADMQKVRLDTEAAQAEHQMKMQHMAGQNELEQQKLERDKEKLALERERVAMTMQAQLQAPAGWGVRQ